MLRVAPLLAVRVLEATSETPPTTMAPGGTVLAVAVAVVMAPGASTIAVVPPAPTRTRRRVDTERATGASRGQFFLFFSFSFLFSFFFLYISSGPNKDGQRETLTSSIFLSTSFPSFVTIARRSPLLRVRTLALLVRPLLRVRLLPPSRQPPSA